MTTGIYAIYWPHNDNAIYVGQSVNIEKKTSTPFMVFKKYSA